MKKKLFNIKKSMTSQIALNIKFQLRLIFTSKNVNLEITSVNLKVKFSNLQM
jgi:hypothetical protein